jgi:CTP:molybdopterin cytidylyltransferase MocA
MTEPNPQFRTVILAGERPGGSPISQAFNVAASVMVPVAGKPSLARVLDTIAASSMAGSGVICGPTREAVEQSEAFRDLLRHSDFEWLEQASGPAASSLAALDKLDFYPALLTAGDHALLTAEIVDDFCQRAMAAGRGGDDAGAAPAFDLVIGFVPYGLVRAAWPESKRTVTKFSDGHYCGSNLFAVLTPAGRKALKFWRQAEADRKQPWKIARRFGYLALFRYLLRRLSLDDALRALSKAAGCRIGHVKVSFAKAAVDVDSVDDQKLAEQILRSSR